MAAKKDAAVGFIFITLLLDVIGFGIIIPVLPKLISELIHGSISDAAKYGGWLMFAFSVMQFLFSPILGNLSDQYGRRPILLISLFGFGLDYLLLAFSPSIGWLFIGRMLSGMMGASFTTASAYIADVSTPEKRAQNFGLVGAAFGLGFIIGPALGGILGSYGSRIPFFAAAGLTFLNWAYGFFILPESLAPENRRKFEWKRANAIGTLVLFRKYKSVLGLIVASFFMYMASHSVQSTWSYYTMQVLNWNETWVGFSLMTVGILVAGVQGGLIRVINPWLGNKKSVYVGLSLYVLGLLLFSISNQTWMMFAFLIPYCLSGIAGPALQSTISAKVPPNEQGELQGALTSLTSLTSIAGPPLMTNLFYLFTQNDAPIIFPGMAFFVGAIFSAISIFFAYKTLVKTPD